MSKTVFSPNALTSGSRPACGPETDTSEICHQPDSLVDQYARRHTYLRVSVTDRCNLRCFYCMPPGGIRHKSGDQLLQFEEITRLVRLFADMGVQKVRLTGGEPLLRSDIEHLIASLAAVEKIQTIGLTTNGVLLREYAPVLKLAGLTTLNVSLDTLRPRRFARVTLTHNYQRVRAGIDAAMRAGFRTLRINVVVLGGINDDELLDFVELAHHDPVDVRFIEFMPFTANGWDQVRFVPYPAMLNEINGRYSLLPVDQIPDPHAVAKEFRIAGFRGTIGFITPLSRPFCGDCNRLRLSADGILRSCLFSRTGLPLRDAIRQGDSTDSLAESIRRFVRTKRPSRPDLDELQHNTDHFIAEVGG